MDIKKIFEQVDKAPVTVEKPFPIKYKIPIRRWKGHAPKLTKISPKKYILIPAAPERPGIVSIVHNSIQFELMSRRFWGNNIFSLIFFLTSVLFLLSFYFGMIKLTNPGFASMIMILLFENLTLLLLIGYFRNNGFMAYVGKIKFWSSVTGLLAIVSFLISSSNVMNDLFINTLAEELEPISKMLGYRSIIDIGPVRFLNFWPLIAFPFVISTLLWYKVRFLTLRKRRLYFIKAHEALLCVSKRKLQIRLLKNAHILSTFRSSKSIRWAGPIENDEHILLITYDGTVEIRDCKTLTLQRIIKGNEFTKIGEIQTSYNIADTTHLIGLLRNNVVVAKYHNEKEEWITHVYGIGLPSPDNRSETITIDGHGSVAWINENSLNVTMGKEDQKIVVQSVGKDFRDWLCYLTYVPNFKMFIAGGMFGTVIAVKIGSPVRIFKYPSEMATTVYDLSFKDEIPDDLMLLKLITNNEQCPVIGIVEEHNNNLLIWAPNGRFLCFESIA